MMRLMVGRRRVGVQGAEGQVAGFGDAQRGLDGFQVAHFADQHHVRVFAEGGAQGVGEALGVGVQFALVDQAVLVHVHKFDRVLDGEDVLVPLGVDLVDHGGQGRGFARAGRSGHQDQPARLVAQLADNGGQAQLVEGLDLERNDAEDAGRGAALVEARWRGNGPGPSGRRRSPARGFLRSGASAASVMTL